MGSGLQLIDGISRRHAVLLIFSLDVWYEFTFQLTRKWNMKQIVDTEIGILIRKSKGIDYNINPANFVKQLFDFAYGKRETFKSQDSLYAALFDLAVTALYLEEVPSTGWYYCTCDEGRHLVYPFVNACPKCTLNGKFRHLNAAKPASAKIGKATSTILAAFLELLAKRATSRKIEIKTLNDNGLVDALLLSENRIVLFEIKASPLVSFPLMAESRKLTIREDGSEEITELQNHSETTVSEGAQSVLLVGEDLTIPTGSQELFSRRGHYDHILKWIKNNENLESYVSSWESMLLGYGSKENRGLTHWLTNGCGTPTPVPKDWPKRKKGSGYESISDGKSSVGLDRTDDVKKGIYQVLKMSTHHKEFSRSGGWEVHCALASNIHAVKHHAEYLKELEDLVWTLDGIDKTYVKHLDDGSTIIEEGRLYNLFDGLISLTQSYCRSNLLKELYE